jgi:hypothetical protein
VPVVGAGGRIFGSGEPDKAAGGRWASVKKIEATALWWLFLH